MGREAESLEKQNSVWIRKAVRGGNLAQAHRHEASGINFIIGRDLGIPIKLA